MTYERLASKLSATRSYISCSDWIWKRNAIHFSGGRNWGRLLIFYFGIALNLWFDFLLYLNLIVVVRLRLLVIPHVYVFQFGCWNKSIVSVFGTIHYLSWMTYQCGVQMPLLEPVAWPLISCLFTCDRVGSESTWIQSKNVDPLPWTVKRCISFITVCTS